MADERIQANIKTTVSLPPSVPTTSVKCDHIHDTVGRVISAAAQEHAYRTVCHRPECLDNAYRHVQSVTGRTGWFHAQTRDGWCQDGVRGARYAHIASDDHYVYLSGKHLFEEHPDGAYALRWDAGDLQAIWLRPGQRIGAAEHGQPLYRPHVCPDCSS